MAGDAKTPGDAKSAPFGNGAGNVASTGGKGQPESYGQSRPQRSGSDPVNPADVPAGGQSIFTDLDPKGADPGNPVGTTAGKGKPPFKVRG